MKSVFIPICKSGNKVFLPHPCIYHARFAIKIVGSDSPNCKMSRLCLTRSCHIRTPSSKDISFSFVRYVFKHRIGIIAQIRLGISVANPLGIDTTSREIPYPGKKIVSE